MTLAILPYSNIAPAAQGFDPRLTDKQKGDIAEKAFDLAASLRRYTVCRPLGEAVGFDFVVMHPDGALIVVQVKWATKEGSRYKIANNSSGVRYGESAYQVLAVFLPDLNRWIFYTRAELGDRTRTTFTPAADRRRAAKLSACEYREMDNWHLLDEVAESLTAHQKSFTPRTADVLPPPVQMSTSA